MENFAILNVLSDFTRKILAESLNEKLNIPFGFFKYFKYFLAAQIFGYFQPILFFLLAILLCGNKQKEERQKERGVVERERQIKNKH